MKRDNIVFKKNSICIETNKVSQQFSRFAYSYDSYNMIQEKVAHLLVGNMQKEKYDVLVDIGCGSGAVYKNILKKNDRYNIFIALDTSREMLKLHPEDSKVQKYYASFNQPFSLNTPFHNTVLLSASALQWSNNLDFTFKELASKGAYAYFAIFTSNTFQTLHKIAGVTSPIYSVQVLQETIEKYYKCTFTVEKYHLSFSSIRKMFQYIKKSGVSGGEKKLSYQEMKKLMREYPLDYLEFEVLYVKAESKSDIKIFEG